jgi:hypothetical protein
MIAETLRCCTPRLAGFRQVSVFWPRKRPGVLANGADCNGRDASWLLESGSVTATGHVGRFTREGASNTTYVWSDGSVTTNRFAGWVNVEMCLPGMRGLDVLSATTALVSKAHHAGRPAGQSDHAAE